MQNLFIIYTFIFISYIFIIYINSYTYIDFVLISFCEFSGYIANKRSKDLFNFI